MTLASTPQDPSNLLVLRDVHTHIGPYHILQGIDLEVEEGKLTMLLGRNGAGKTTTLRTIMGLWRASGGSLHFDGGSITHLSTPAIARLGIGYVPENMGIFGDLTVRENMVLATRRGTFNSERLEWIFGTMPALKKFWEYPAGLLSGGQKQMLSIARAVIEPKRLYIVDEPSKGLAPAIINNLIAAFVALKQSGATLLVVEQNLHFAQSIGDRAVVIDDGKTVFTGAMHDLATNAQMAQDLLGLALH